MKVNRDKSQTKWKDDWCMSYELWEMPAKAIRNKGNKGNSEIRESQSNTKRPKTAPSQPETNIIMLCYE